MGVNSLPKTVTRQRRDCDLNLGPSAPESSTLTTRLTRWYTRPKTVTHPSTNRAQRGWTSFMRWTPLTTTPRRQDVQTHQIFASRCLLSWLSSPYGGVTICYVLPVCGWRHSCLWSARQTGRGDANSAFTQSDSLGGSTGPPWLAWVPASAGVRAGMSALPGGR